MVKKRWLLGAMLVLCGYVFAQSTERDPWLECVHRIGPKVTRVSFGVSRRNLLKAEPYIDGNLRAHLHMAGTTTVWVLINTEGKVVCAVFKEGHPMLSAASLEAARRLRYRPYLLNRNPVAVETPVVFDYAEGKFEVHQSS